MRADQIHQQKQGRLAAPRGSIEAVRTHVAVAADIRIYARSVVNDGERALTRADLMSQEFVRKLLSQLVEPESFLNLAG